MTILSLIRKLLGSGKTAYNLPPTIDDYINEFYGLINKECKVDDDCGYFPNFEYLHSLRNFTPVETYKVSKNNNYVFVSIVQYVHKLSISNIYSIEEEDLNNYLIFYTNWKKNSNINKSDFEIYEIVGDTILFRFDLKPVNMNTIRKDINRLLKLLE